MWFSSGNLAALNNRSMLSPHIYTSRPYEENYTSRPYEEKCASAAGRIPVAVAWSAIMRAATMKTQQSISILWEQR